MVLDPRRHVVYVMPVNPVQVLALLPRIVKQVSFLVLELKLAPSLMLVMDTLILQVPHSKHVLLGSTQRQEALVPNVLKVRLASLAQRSIVLLDYGL